MEILNKGFDLIFLEERVMVPPCHISLQACKWNGRLGWVVPAWQAKLATSIYSPEYTIISKLLNLYKICMLLN